MEKHTVIDMLQLHQPTNLHPHVLTAIRYSEAFTVVMEKTTKRLNLLQK